MKLVKKLGIFALLLALFVSSLPAMAAGPNGDMNLKMYDVKTGTYGDVTVSVVNLLLDGEAMDFKGGIPAVVQNINGFGRTLVPFRAVGEALGANVLWSPENQQAIFRKGTTTVVLTLGSATAVVNGKDVPLPDGVPATALGFPGNSNSSVMMPLRFVSEQLGCKVDWEGESYTAKITRPLATTTQITRVTADHDKQTVLIATDHPPVFRTEDHGGKVVVDVLGAELSSGFPGAITVDNDLITTVRYAQHENDLYPDYAKTVRVVLDLKEGLTLAKNVKAEKTDEGILLTTFLTDEDMDKRPEPELPTIDPTKKTIALDAGHGGSASGAVYEGIKEKDMTLQMTKILEKKLIAMGYNVVMIRSTDVYMDLYDRCDIANAAKADLFVSIHCNAFPKNPDIQGVITYFHPSSKRGETLARTLQPYMAKASGAKDRGIQKDDFVVLRETEMCAVLIETGFMTNHDELMRLADPVYQEKLMQGAADGLTAYLNALGQ